MGATIAFYTSLILLIAFFGFKLFEHSRSMRTYTSLRAKGDRVVAGALSNVRYHGTRIEKQLSIRNMARLIAHHTVFTIARIAHRIEMHAHQAAHRISKNGNGVARTTKSNFLEEVHMHKQNLDTERVRRETSFTQEDSAN